MPQFSDYQEVEVEMNISVQEFFDEMTDKQRMEMIKLIFSSEAYNLSFPEGRGVEAQQFNDAIKTLAGKYLNLTNSEVDQIITLAKRF